MNYETITYPHKCCIFETTSGDSINIILVGTHLVKEVLCTAKELIENDVAEVFYYKYPTPTRLLKHRPDFYYSTSNSTDSDGHDVNKGAIHPIDEKSYFDYNNNDSAISFPEQYTAENGKGDVRHPDEIEWSPIERFAIRDVASQIRDYIEMWTLMPGTKCALLTRDDIKMIPNKGYRYYVDALFSNPTPKCPNPLAVAKVHFHIHISELMPRYYPVMVTYRFEGFKTIYYALGRKQSRSLDFQRFFIDTILHMKLKFYAELFECRFPAEKHSDGADEELDYECEIGKEEDFMDLESESGDSLQVTHSKQLISDIDMELKA